MCEKAQAYPPVEYPGVEKAPSGRISPERSRSIPTHPGKVAGIGSEHRPNSPRNGGRIHVGTVAGLASEWWPDCVGICIFSRNEMRKPKVSIGLPVYNGQLFIGRALDSIIKQNFEDFELIISDNASKDDTKDICRQYVEKDRRISYYRFEQNTGAANNYNHVFRLSRGIYFKWAAHDDECHPAFLRRCVESLDSAPESVVMVYPQAELIDEEGKTLRTGSDRIESRDIHPHRRLAKILLGMNLCDPVFGLYKTKYLQKTNLIAPFFGADNVLLAEMAMLGEIRELDEILFRMRAHSLRSMKANPSARARAVWYDPSAARKLFIMPNWERMVWEMLKAVSRSKLHPADKAKSFLTVPGVHYWRRFRNAGGLIKNRMKQCIASMLVEHERDKIAERKP